MPLHHSILLLPCYTHFSLIPQLYLLHLLIILPCLTLHLVSPTLYLHNFSTPLLLSHSQCHTLIAALPLLNLFPCTLVTSLPLPCHALTASISLPHSCCCHHSPPITALSLSCFYHHALVAAL